MTEQIFTTQRVSATLQQVLEQLLASWQLLPESTQQEIDERRAVLAAGLPPLQPWARTFPIVQFLTAIEGLPGTLAVAGAALRRGKGAVARSGTGFIPDEEMARLVALLKTPPPPPSRVTRSGVAIPFYADVTFPGVVVSDQMAALVVRLTPEPPTTLSRPSAMVEFSDLDASVPVEVVVTAPGFGEETGIWSRTLQVFADRVSQPALFLLRPIPEQGVRRILVSYYTSVGADAYLTRVAAASPIVKNITGTLEAGDAGGAAASLAVPGGESDRTVELYTRVDFPGRIRPGAERPLIIQLTLEQMAESAVSQRVGISFGNVDRPERVDVKVTAPGFQERTQDWTRTITVYSGADSQPAVFMLEAGTTQGRQAITVDFYHRGRTIGSAEFETEISNTAPTDDTSALGVVRPLPVLDRLPRDPPPPADVELRIVKAAGANLLTFTLHSRLARVGYHFAPMGSTLLSEGNPRDYMVGRFQDLSNWAASPAQEMSPDEAGRVITAMETLGEELFTELFPPELQRAYWKLKKLREEGVVHSLLITSDEPWIPWELVKPYDRESDARDDFLAGAFQLCRWLAGPGLADEVQVKSARLVVPELDLAFVDRERSYFDLIGQRGIDVGTYLHSRDEVLALGRAQGIQLVHVAAHGTFNSQNADESPVVLQDGAELFPRDMKGSRVRNLSLSRPIVFLNACHSAQIAFTLTGLGGWADVLVNDVRVSAFIGGMWEVNDELAAEFARQFYDNLWQEMTLGEAFHAARLTIRERNPANSTWLAYTLYGDPNIRVHWRKAP